MALESDGHCSHQFPTRGHGTFNLTVRSPFFCVFKSGVLYKITACRLWASWVQCFHENLCQITGTPMESMFCQTATQIPLLCNFITPIDAYFQREFNGWIFIQNESETRTVVTFWVSRINSICFILKHRNFPLDKNFRKVCMRFVAQKGNSNHSANIANYIDKIFYLVTSFRSYLLCHTYRR